jgi:hypothetical protein
VGPIDNRMIIYLVSPGGGAAPFLVLIKCVLPLRHGCTRAMSAHTARPPARPPAPSGVNLCDTTIADLRALETAQGAAIRYVISTGDWHWVYLGMYATYWPNATGASSAAAPARPRAR